MRARRTIASALLAVLALFALVACGSSSGPAASDATTTTAAADTTSSSASTPNSTEPPDPALAGEVRVEAAASLKEAFTSIAAAFEQSNPGVKVTLDFGPSSGLSDSIVAGAPADVFASADTKNMDKLVTAKLVPDDASSMIFARNRPEIAVPADNPGKVTGLADFAKADLLVGLCAEDVPCGKFARTVLMNAGVTPSIDTNEPDVKALLGKIETDDLDVGLVYHTDVVAAGDKVKGIVIPEDANVVAAYPIAVLLKAPNGDAAQAFADFVRAADSQKVLLAAGFLAP